MKAVAGVCYSKDEAEKAVGTARSAGVPAHRIIALTPGDIRRKGVLSRPIGSENTAFSRGRRAELKAAGPFEGMPLFVTLVPGVGVATAVGLLGAALLVTAGQAAETFANTNSEDSSVQGLLEKIFLYEDDLRRGGSVVILIVDEAVAESWLLQLSNSGAESIDHTCNRWWNALRGVERANYATLNRNFETLSPGI